MYRSSRLRTACARAVEELEVADRGGIEQHHTQCPSVSSRRGGRGNGWKGIVMSTRIITSICSISSVNPIYIYIYWRKLSCITSIAPAYLLGGGGALCKDYYSVHIL